MIVGNFNIWQNSNLSQGTSILDAPLGQYLNPGYVKAEPRTTAYWIDMIRAMGKKLKPGTEENWADLIPSAMATELLADYIEDPRGVIDKKQLSDKEIEQLRQPQRIVLFYFLRKLKPFEVQNDLIIKGINNLLARQLFEEQPDPAKPDQGYAVIVKPLSQSIEIPKGTLIDAVVEGEVPIRQYEVAQQVIGQTLDLDCLMLALPVRGQQALQASSPTLPLKNIIRPFSHVAEGNNDFRPALVLQSTLLQMSEGTRVISLKLQVANLKGPEVSNTNPFRFQITTATGWLVLEPFNQNLDFTDGLSADYLFCIKENEPALEPLAKPVTGEAYASLMSALKVTSIQGIDSFQILNAELGTVVLGLKPAAARNQELVVDVGDSFLPFGQKGEMNSVFSFSHAELCNRSIEEIFITLGWVGKPADLTTYYEAYPRPEKDFKVQIEEMRLSQNGSGHKASLIKEAGLFDSLISFSPDNPSRSIDTQMGWDKEEKDPLKQPLCYQLKLNYQDFGQADYPLLMSQYTIALAAQKKPGFFQNIGSWFSNEKPKPLLPVNIPYVPLMSHVKLDYISEPVSWQKGESHDRLNLIETTPGGYRSYQGGVVEIGEDQYGALYLGLSDYSPGQRASLYFQGTNGIPSCNTLPVQWKYLSKEGWQDVSQSDLLSDNTFELTQGGLFYWRTAPDAELNGSLMPKGYYWLKAIAKSGTKTTAQASSLMGIKGIYANAFPIRRLQSDLEGSKINSPLPAGSQLSFHAPFAALKVALPCATKGGIQRETEAGFWMRVFNRMRNRGRPVHPDSYEDIILNANRNIVRVKCVPRTAYESSLQIVVIGKPKTVDAKHPKVNFKELLPYISAHQLMRIQQQLLPLASPFFGESLSECDLQIRITNPRYAEVGFIVHVAFTNVATVAENKSLLFRAIQSFIDPWFFKDEAVPRFGQWFNITGLQSYLQSQNFIQEVFNIRMFRLEGAKRLFSEALEFKPDEVLVLTNKASVVVNLNINAFMNRSIGEYAIGIDFSVNANTQNAS